MEFVAGPVEELAIALVNVGLFETVAALVSAVEQGPLEEVSQPRFVKSLPLTRLDEVALRHLVGLTLDDYFDSFAEVARVDLRHRSVLFNSDRWKTIRS